MTLNYKKLKKKLDIFNENSKESYVKEKQFKGLFIWLL